MSFEVLQRDSGEVEYQRRANMAVVCYGGGLGGGGDGEQGIVEEDTCGGMWRGWVRLRCGCGLMCVAGGR